MQLVLGATLLAAFTSVQAASPSVEAVSRLYADFAWEAVITQPQKPGLAQQPEAALLRYFTPRLASALAADARCALRNGEICALDFAPLWWSQDPAAQDLTVAPGSSSNQVQVEFTVPSTQQRVSLQVWLVSTKAGWRVTDIAYPSGSSLAKLLSGNAK